MSRLNQAAIVVGVSGSRASAAALRWAADEARRRHARLRVVRSWEPEFAAPYAAADTRIGPAQQRALAREGLTAAMRSVFGSVMPDGVAGELAEGAAERVLADRSAGAALLVLGSASPGSASPPTPIGQSVGPVIRACLSRAQCPVVVVSTDQKTVMRPAAGEPHTRRTHTGDTTRGHDLTRPRPGGGVRNGTDPGQRGRHPSAGQQHAIVPAPRSGD